MVLWWWNNAYCPHLLAVLQFWWYPVLKRQRRWSIPISPLPSWPKRGKEGTFGWNRPQRSTGSHHTFRMDTAPVHPPENLRCSAPSTAPCQSPISALALSAHLCTNWKETRARSISAAALYLLGRCPQLRGMETGGKRIGCGSALSPDQMFHMHMCSFNSWRVGMWLYPAPGLIESGLEGKSHASTVTSSFSKQMVWTQFTYLTQFT